LSFNLPDFLSLLLLLDDLEILIIALFTIINNKSGTASKFSKKENIKTKSNALIQ
jgi:hypothetical protein